MVVQNDKATVRLCVGSAGRWRGLRRSGVGGGGVLPTMCVSMCMHVCG